MQRKTILIISLFLLAAGVKTVGVTAGSTVPPGWTDTSYHVATSLDVSEGEFDSLFHPWWHMEGNSEEINGFSVIDRNSKTFFYPPFLHLFTGLFMLFLPAGIAAIVSTSILYALSVPGVYLLARSYGVSEKSSAIGGLFAGLSPVLMQSQVMGFWSFAVAFNFLILSYASFRFYDSDQSWLSAVGFIGFGLLSILTHWTFGLPVVALPGIHILLSRNLRELLPWNTAYHPIAGILLISAPFYLLFLATSDLSTYIGTSFDGFYHGTGLLVMLTGFVLSRNRKTAVNVLTVIMSGLMGLYYLAGFKILFGDMIQFAVPVIAGFYLAELLERSIDTEKEKLYLLIGIGLVLTNGFAGFQIAEESPRAISENEFDMLLDARNTDYGDSILFSENLGTWITIGSRQNRIVNPYIQANTSRLQDLAGFQQIGTETL